MNAPRPHQEWMAHYLATHAMQPPPDAEPTEYERALATIYAAERRLAEAELCPCGRHELSGGE